MHLYLTHIAHLPLFAIILVRKVRFLCHTRHRESVIQLVAVKVPAVGLVAVFAQIALQELLFDSVEKVRNHSLCISNTDMYPRQHLADVFRFDYLADVLCEQVLEIVV